VTEHRRTWLKSLPFVALSILALVAITRQTAIPWRYFFTDLPVVLQVPVMACVFTSASAVLWCSSGLIALFASTLCSPDSKRPLRILGVLSVVLGADDLAMIHETLLPRALGMTEKMQGIAVESVVFLSYACVLLGWLIAYFKKVGWDARPFLIGAILCFAFSLAADMASSLKLFGRWSRFRTDYDFQMLVEDGPKFVGVVLWSIFAWHYSRSTLTSGGDAN